MFVTVVPAALHDFASMRFILLFRGIRKQADIVMDVKIEKWTRLSSGLVHYEVVECMVLRAKDK